MTVGIRDHCQHCLRDLSAEERRFFEDFLNPNLPDLPKAPWPVCCGRMITFKNEFRKPVKKI